MINSNAIGLLGLGTLGGRITQDYITKAVVDTGYIPAVAGISSTHLTNAGLGVLGLLGASSKGKDDNKIVLASFGSRMLTDVAYDLVKGYMSEAPTARRYSRPRPIVRARPMPVQMARANAPQSNYEGLVQVD